MHIYAIARQVTIVVLIIVSLISTADTIYVDGNAMGTESGTSWANAFTDLQDALAAASSGDQIWVATGNYKPGDNQSDTFTLINGVEIYGGFSGSETSLVQRSPSGNETTLSGDLADLTSYHVVTAWTDATSSAILDGFTIEEGNSATQHGGGIYVYGGSPTLRNLEVSNNDSAFSNGGGLYVFGGSEPLVIEDCLFQFNNADEGGSIFIDGGAIVRATSTRFYNEDSDDDGGAIKIEDGELYTVNCYFDENDAQIGDGGNGGAVYLLDGAATFVNTIFYNNDADKQGGAVAWSSGTVTLINCTLYANQTAINGRSLYGFGGDLVMQNSILWGQLSSNDLIETAGTYTIQNCIIQGGEKNASSSDPLLIKPNDGIFLLQASSPAVNNGNNSYLPADVLDIDGDSNTAETLPLDYGNLERIQNSTVDIGAHEGGFSTGPIIYVDLDAPSGGTGEAWTSALQSVSLALSLADTNDQVWVAEGTYYPTTSTDRSISFSINDDVSLYGGFKGDETSLSQRNWRMYPTILSGDIGTMGWSPDNTETVVYMEDVARIDGFIVQDGYAAEFGAAGIYAGGFGEGGGGAYLANLTVRDCYGIYVGGGILVDGGVEAIVHNVEVFNCESGFAGGGICIGGDAIVEMANIALAGNKSMNGAGIYIFEDAEVSILGASSSHNEADDGGGIYAENGSEGIILELRNCAFWDNTASSNLEISANGADSDIDFSNCIIEDWTGATQSNPMFMDPANNDLRLQFGSPAINAGNNSSIPVDALDLDGDGDTAETLPLDLDLQARVQLSPVDLGAYEGPTIWYVDYTSTSGAETGLDWTNAFLRVQDGLAVSESGDQIWIAQGTYTPTLDLDTSVSYELVSGVPVYGGFAGTETLASQRDSSSYETILSGLLDGASMKSEIVVTVPSDTAECELHDLTIKNGSRSGNGAGLVVNGQLSSSSITVSDCTATNGGGIFVGSAGSLTIVNSTIKDNNAINGSGLMCGGLMTIYNTLFTGNNASSYGCLVQTVTGSSSSIVGNCTFSGNVNSGGVFSQGSDFTIRNSIIYDNGGNALTITDSGSLTVSNSIVEGGWTGATNSDVDPNLDGDFMITSTSSAYNHGNNSSLPVDELDIDKDGNTSEILPLDLARNARIFQITVDAGAFEAPYSPPVAVDDAWTSDSDILLSVSAGSGVLSNDTTYGAITLTVATNVSNGVLNLSNDGSFTYFPSDGFIGTDFFVYDLSDGITTAQATATLTIQDPSRTVSIAGTTTSEADITVNLVVTLNQVSGRDVLVDYDTSDLTATAGSDYDAASSTATISAGQLTTTIPVTINSDFIDENDESFRVTLSNPQRASLGTSTGDVTITDNDDPPTVSISSNSASEGDDINFKVSLGQPSSFTVTVNFSTTAGTASLTDFSSTQGTLTFSPGTTHVTATVPTTEDSIDENNEQFSVTLTNAINADLGESNALGTIIDDDDPPTVSIGDATITEGSDFSFEVTLSTVSSFTVTVAYSTTIGSATGDDFTSATGTATISAGQLTTTIPITTTDDSLDEFDESMGVTLSSPTNAILDDSTGTGTIEDNDDPPAMYLSNSTAADEGNSLTFFIDLSTASAKTITVNYSTTNGTAGDADYTTIPTPLTATFVAGQTQFTVTIPITEDTLDETDETFTVDLSNATNATILNAQSTGTIQDDDDPPTASINDVSADEGDGLSFTVSLSTASGLDVSVAYSTTIGTAGNSDFISVMGSATISAGDTTATVTISSTEDTLLEADETFTVTLSSPSNTTLNDASGTGTINNDDAPPAISIDDVTESEGDSFSFTVSLSTISGLTTTVQYSTTIGTADNGDFTGKTGTATIPAGLDSTSVTISSTEDPIDEPDETFFVNLSSPTNATLNDSQGQGTIQDDDDPPTASIASAEATEGNNINLTVTLSQYSSFVVSVPYSTSISLGSATTSDFISEYATITIPAGQTQGTVTIATVNDTLDEDDETFAVIVDPLLIGKPIGPLDPGDTWAVAIIRDDDDPPTISIGDISASEGDNLEFPVSLSAASSFQIMVQYSTTVGTAGTGDFTGSMGTLTIPDGDTEGIITVQSTEDTTDEPDETFTVTLSNPVRATLDDDNATGTIQDDDEPPVLSISDAEASEGDDLAFSVSLSVVSAFNVTVPYSTTLVTAESTDFVSTMATATIPAGSTQATVTIPSSQDTIIEDNETFELTILTPGHGTFTDATPVGTILDDEPAQIVSINDASATEGDALSFTVSLTFESEQTASITVSTSPDSATSVDFTATSQTLTFNPGVMTQTFVVSTTEDTLDEEDETLIVTLSDGVNTDAGSPGTGTILDDDDPPIASASTETGDEGNSLTFTISLSGPSGKTIGVSATATESTALEPEDFSLAGGSVTFLPGQITQTVSVTTNDDLLDEYDEIFYVTLQSPVNCTLEPSPQYTGTIIDNDTPPMVSILDADITEGDSGEAQVVLASASGKEIQVSWLASANTALPGIDYSDTSGTITFAAGQITRTIPLSTLEDTLDEPDESFSLFLHAPVNVVIDDDQNTTTILDDDEPGTISIGDAIALEGDAGSHDMTFLVSLNGPSGQTITVVVGTQGDSATTDIDYTSTMMTLTFAPGEITRQVMVPIWGDARTEIDETFSLSILSMTNITADDGEGTGTIVDDDPMSTLSIGDASATEGNDLVMTISLDWSSGDPVSVAWATSDETAISPTDYVSSQGTATIPAGQTAITITIPTVSDDLFEVDETFLVTLSNLTGDATYGQRTAQGTITNDDPLPEISYATELRVNEGDDFVEIQITLSAPIGSPITFIYQTQDGGAIAIEDYDGGTGSVTFQPGGSLTESIIVPIIDDDFREPEEAFTVTFDGFASISELSNNNVEISIIDNDRSSNAIYTIKTKGYVYLDNDQYRLKTIKKGYLVVDHRRGLAAMLQKVQAGDTVLPICEIWSSDTLIIPELDNGTNRGFDNIFNVDFSASGNDLGNYAFDIMTGNVRSTRLSQWVNGVFSRSLKGNGWSVPGAGVPFAGFDYVTYSTSARYQSRITLPLNNDQYTWEDVVDYYKDELGLAELNTDEQPPDPPDLSAREEFRFPTLIYKVKAKFAQKGNGFSTKGKEAGYLVVNKTDDTIIWIRAWEENGTDYYEAINLEDQYAMAFFQKGDGKKTIEVIAGAYFDWPAFGRTDEDEARLFHLEGYSKPIGLNNLEVDVAKKLTGRVFRVWAVGVEEVNRVSELKASYDKSLTGDLLEFTAEDAADVLILDLQDHGYQPLSTEKEVVR